MSSQVRSAWHNQPGPNRTVFKRRSKFSTEFIERCFKNPKNYREETERGNGRCAIVSDAALKFSRHMPFLKLSGKLNRYRPWNKSSNLRQPLVFNLDFWAIANFNLNFSFECLSWRKPCDFTTFGVCVPNWCAKIVSFLTCCLRSRKGVHFCISMPPNLLETSDGSSLDGCPIIHRCMSNDGTLKSA